ncbi:MAG TPA: 50S ribosomal protein L25 [Pedomonas sp.]|uniref:50S ribosomal protein L25 n=1 Tax=Pedomonas sp. TaxID=2976421 RepID=UPI002F402D76
MSNVLSVKAELRTGAGKGVARAARKNGQAPAVIYGMKTEPTLILIEENELWKALNKGTYFDSIIEIEVDGKVERTIARDVQFHPVTDRPLHVDFLRVPADFEFEAEDEVEVEAEDAE